MNLTPLQHLLPEWEFRLDGRVLRFWVKDASGSFRYSDRTELGRDHLSGLIERALLKRGWRFTYEADPDPANPDYAHVYSLDQGEGHGADKLAALLAVIERLPGLGAEEKE